MNSQASRPTIVHLIPTIVGNGGGETQLAQNLEFLDRDRLEHIVVYIRPPSTTSYVRPSSKPMMNRFERMGVRVECIDPEGKHGFLRRALRLWKFIRSNNVKLIHTTNAEADKLGGFAGFLARVPVAATLNSVGYTDEWYQSLPGVNIWKMRYMKFSRKLALRLFVDRFNAVSTIAKTSFAETLGLPEDKIDVIYRGVDLERFPERTEWPAWPRKEGPFPRILMVGRLVNEKGQRYAIDAMPTILKEFPNAHLQIVGQGYLTDSLNQQISDLGIEDAVTLSGYRPDIPQLLHDADIFLFPSLSEGCPNALLEAMAVGLPCVAAESEAAKEIITSGENGILTPLRDGDAIAEAVMSITRDPQCARRLGNAAARHIADHFSIRRATLALEDFYVRMREQLAADTVAREAR